MKRILKLIYIVFILTILCIPVGYMRFYNSKNTENRELEKMPVVVNEIFSKDFGEKIESYVSDNFAFRDKLINANNMIKAKIFGVSGNKKVTIGKDDWLFYTESLDDVTSESVMTDREIFCVTRTLELISNYVKSFNGRFIFTIAPNKAGLYSQYLPYYYKKSDVPNSMDKVLNKLNNVDYLNLKTVFEDNSEVLYHKLDTHWNNKGAFLVTSSLLKYLKLDNVKSYSEPEKKQDWDGDLSKMLFPDMDYKDEQYYYNENEFNYTHTRRFKGTDDMIISTENKQSDNGSILIFRDSFGRSLIQFISDNFSKSVFSRNIPYDINQISKNHYDFVVFEIVERNIDNIISKAPYMEAQVVDVDLNNVTKLDDNEYELTYEKNNINHIYGKILNNIKEDTKIYLNIGNEFYEAFPCYELKEDESSDGMGNGFSLYTSNNSDKINIYISK